MRRSTGSSDADGVTDPAPGATEAPAAPPTPRVSRLSRIVFWFGVAAGVFGLREAAFARNRADDRRR